MCRKSDGRFRAGGSIIPTALARRLVIFTLAVASAGATGGFTETQKLTASDGGPGESFGNSVAVSGKTIVVGAFLDDGNQGAAYVFEPDGAGGFTETQKLTASDGAAFHQFGFSVAVSGDTIVVGAQAADGNQGAAYVFEPDGAGGFTETQKLTASDGAAFDEFGYSVAISGGTIVVGARFDDGHQGAAYVFGPDGAGGFTETQKLTASDGAALDRFGFSVAISGDTIVVGATLHAADQGAAYVFEPDGAGGFTETQKLMASDGEEEDFFGFSVAISGGAIVVSAEGDDAFQGAAYVFEPDGAGGFTETQKLTASDGTAFHQFGFSVAVSGGTIVVGAIRDDSSQGAGYVFEPDGAGGFTEAQKLTASDGASFDLFGFSVAVSGGTIVVGAVSADSQGAAYVFISASDQLGALIDGVAQLINDGSLNDGQGNSLTSKLEGVLKDLESGQTVPAINLLNAFINEVESLVEEGVLTSGEGDALINAAYDIIDAILA